MRHLKWLVKIRLVEQHKDFKIPQTRFERCGSFFERSLDQPCYFEFCSQASHSGLATSVSELPK